MSTDVLSRILQQLDEKAARYSRLGAYAAGQQPLTFLAPEIRTQLNNRLARVAVNVPGLLVGSLVERLRITGFSRPDVWGDWLANGMPELSAVAHREALILGESFAIVWANDDGSPRVTVESPMQTTALTNPATREITLAAKRWEVPDGPKAGTWAVLYGPDKITRYHSQAIGATTLGFNRVDTIDNPLGVVPVVRFRNGGRLLDDGLSEMSDAIPLVDALVKLTTDLLTSSEYAARPRRWATGLELSEDPATGAAVNPISEGDRLMVNEAPDGKFGQLPGADLAGYQTAIQTVMRLISATTGLPDHMLGLTGENPTSADSIRASEAALTAKAEAKQLTFGRAWGQVAALMAAVRDGSDPRASTITPTWADPSTRSAAQEADAVVKLHAAGIITTAEARERLGIDTHQEGTAA